MPRLPPSPELDWTESGAPRGRRFGDVYFSNHGGLAEADTVFVRGCGLPDAWRGRRRFAVCELGFGAGLNVLALWRAWKATRPPHAVLHISSVEAFPLDKADAARALRCFPEIADLASPLLARWPVRAYAPQRLWFPEDGFALTLHTGEAAQVLAGMRGAFDAWFLDGFAPSRNPEMWSHAVFAHMARLSAPGARAATFTVAGDVRRGLETAGFAVEKRPGFAGKRERLEARLERPAVSTPSLYPFEATEPKRVAVLGAGLAGAACASALARREVETIVLDAAPALGAGASGNPAGLVMPRLDRGEGPLRELYLAAYLDAVAVYEALGVFDACGVVQHGEERGAEALAQLLADPPLPADWFAPGAGGAVLHARAGLARPQAAIQAWLRRAELMCEAPVESLERSGEAWVLRAPDGRALLRADAVVLACGPALKRFTPAEFLPLELTRGQIEWGDGASPDRARARGSYVAPFENGVLFGATFDKPFDADMMNSGALAEARARNLAALAKLAPELAEGVKAQTLNSRASLRAAAPDRAPVAGSLPDAEAWLAQNKVIAAGRTPPELPAPAHRGVYVIGALGARGLTLAPLAGERVAAEMFNEPQALSNAALNAMHPARFLHRALKRR